MTVLYKPWEVSPPVKDYLASVVHHRSMSDVRYYLKKFENKLEEPSAGRTPLLWAISMGREEAMKLLLSHDADIKKKTESGDSALACAVWSGKAKMVQLMLERGLDPAAKNNQGKTALDWAHERGADDIIKLLEEPTHVAVEKHRAAGASRKRDALKDLARRKKVLFKP